MARRAAQVASGLKAPIAVGDQVQPTPANGIVFAPAAPKLPRAEGVRRFASKYNNYRLQITSPRDTFDIATGVKTIHRGKVAQFSEGILETADAEVIERIENSRYFGSDMWDADAREAQSLRTSVEAMVAALKSSGNEELMARVVESLGAKFAEEFTPNQEAA